MLGGYFRPRSSSRIHNIHCCPIEVAYSNLQNNVNKSNNWWNNHHGIATRFVFNSSRLIMINNEVKEYHHDAFHRSNKIAQQQRIISDRNYTTHCYHPSFTYSYNHMSKNLNSSKQQQHQQRVDMMKTTKRMLYSEGRNENDNNNSNNNNDNINIPIQRSKRKTDNSLSSRKTTSLNLMEMTTTDQKQQQSMNNPNHNNSHIDSTPLLTKRRLDVAIVGLPNAGKSQLLNLLVESNVSAVSNKRHTTRDSNILGARTIYPTTMMNNEINHQNVIDSNNKGNDSSDPNIECTVPTQLLFIDTPGFLRVNNAKKEGLNRDLMVSAKSSMEYVDYTLLVVDSAKSMTDSVKESFIELMLQAIESNGRVEDEDDSDIDDYDEDDDDETDIDTDDHSNDDMNSDDSDEDDDDVDDEESKNRQDNVQHQPVSVYPKFAVVLNKVDLIHPKSDLIDIAMEIGTLAEQTLIYHYNTNIIPQHQTQQQDQKQRKNKYPVEAIKNQVNNEINVNKHDVNQLNHDDIMIDQKDDNNNDVALYLEQNMPIFFYTSAKQNEGIDDIVQHLIDISTPCHVWDIDPKMKTTLTMKEQIEEIIREKLYRCLHKEIPYHITQQNKMLQIIPSSSKNNMTQSGISTTGNKDVPTVIIHQDLIVYSKSHQTIVHGGTKKQTLERIRSTAEYDLSKTLFNCPVQLHIQVKWDKSKNNNNNNKGNNSTDHMIDYDNNHSSTTTMNHPKIIQKKGQYQRYNSRNDP